MGKSPGLPAQLPAVLQQKIQQVNDPEVLDYVLEELFTANTLEEARTIINDGLKVVQKDKV